MDISGITDSAVLQMQALASVVSPGGENGLRAKGFFPVHDNAKNEGAFQAALNSAIENKDKPELRKACVAFEGYFVQMMFKEMRKSVDSSMGILPKGQAERIFEGMLDEEVAKSVAEGRGIGLADEMYRQLEKNI